MELFSLLSVPIGIFTESYTVDINFIGKFIGILCGAMGVGFGIIVFSLILKVITLPFDVMQRITMRKQNIQMKENQARMEKLQKQYANDKDAYNQKVMEMYKENGMSMFSSCLPMILSMVIFFIAIGAFNSYSAYANVENYNQLVDAYNSAIVREISDVNEENLSLTDVRVKTEKDENEQDVVTAYYFIYTVEDKAANGKPLYFTATYEEDNLELVSFNETEPLKSVRYKLDTEGNKVVVENKEIVIYLQHDLNEFFKEQAKNQVNYTSAEKNAIKEEAGRYEKSYLINDEKIKAGKDGYYKDVYTAIEQIKTGLQTKNPDETEDNLWALAYKNYFENLAQIEVVAAYNGTGDYAGVANNTKFLWIKNVWVTDAMYKNPVLEYKDFETAIATKSGCSCTTSNKAAQFGAYQKDGYNKVTAKLDKQKDQFNGYFVLIALSIGTILLQQFVSMRAQKEQQKYSSVDGQGAGQQKMMMIVMTGMFAIFSFMYSSAFSIYLIMSNLFSLGSTLIINKIVDKTAENKDAKAAEKKFNERYGGRVAAARSAGQKSARDQKNKKTGNNANGKNKK